MKFGDCNLISNALGFLKHTGDISPVINFHVTDLWRIVNQRSVEYSYSV